MDLVTPEEVHNVEPVTHIEVRNVEPVTPMEVRNVKPMTLIEDCIAQGLNFRSDLKHFKIKN